MRFMLRALAAAACLFAAQAFAQDVSLPNPLPAAMGGTGAANQTNPLAYGVLYSSAGAPTAAGTVYVPGETVTLTGGTFTTAAVLSITDTKAVSGTVAAAGSGGSNGACTVTGTTGTGTKAQFSGTVSGGVLTGPLTVAVAGDYTVNPTSIAAEPVTGCTLTGAQVNMVMGGLKHIVANPGLYSVTPANPVAQGSTSGSGSGATFTLSWGPIAAAVSATSSVNNGNVVVGDTSAATNPMVCAIGMKCVIGVLRSANFNITTDQSITIRPLTLADTGYIAKATKYFITDIYVANCSASLTTAKGAFYTAASKGGTIIGATTTPFTNCASTTTTHRLTGLTNQDTTVFSAATLFLSLTTAQGGAATADVYIIGELLN